MDFYCALKSCYRKGMSPFALYSELLDLCKGDIKLKNEIDCFYQLYKRGDIFEKISLCNQNQFDELVKSYDKKEKDCLFSVAMLLHNDWNLTASKGESKKVKIKVQRAAQSVQQGKSKKRPLLNNLAIIKPVAQNKPVLANKPVQKAKKANKVKKAVITPRKKIKVSSLLSNVDITTCLGAADIEMRVVQNGRWTSLNKGIIRRKDCTYINVDGIVADKIEILVPKGKYESLEVNKIHGDLSIVDRNDCFEKVIVNLNSGKLVAVLGARSIITNVVAGRVYLEHQPTENANLEILNEVGGVRVLLLSVKKANFNLVSSFGNITNKFQQNSKGVDLTIKVRSKYGNVYVF